MNIASLLEFIGFDVLFIGILTFVVARIGVRLWNHESCRDLCVSTINDCGNLFGGSRTTDGAPFSSEISPPPSPTPAVTPTATPSPTPTPAPTPAGTATPPAAPTLQIAGILVIAAVIGMTANFMADELLDSGMLRWVPLLEIKADSKWELKRGPPAEEDAVKLRVLAGLVEKGVLKPSEREAFSDEFLKRHENNKEPKEATKDLDEAKAFFQTALVSVLRQSSSDAAVASLRAEFMVVRVFRVLFLYSLVLVVSTFTAGVIHVMWPLTRPRKQMMSRSVVAVVWLLFLSYLFLWSWAYQSKRYYKKLAYSSFAAPSPQRSRALY